jgi:hypothetical protein
LLEGTVDKRGGEKQGVSRKLQNKTWSWVFWYVLPW